MHRRPQLAIEPLLRPQTNLLLLGHQIVEGFAITADLLIQSGQLPLDSRQIVIGHQLPIVLVKI